VTVKLARATQRDRRTSYGNRELFQRCYADGLHDGDNSRPHPALASAHTLLGPRLLPPLDLGYRAAPALLDEAVTRIAVRSH
jgi:hypothetical protein